MVVVLCTAMLCNVVLRCATFSVMLDYVMLRCAMLLYFLQFCAMLYYVVLHYATLDYVTLRCDMFC